MLKQSEMKKFLGKEVVVIAGDDAAFTKISIYENMADASEYLKIKDLEEYYDTKAYHGVLARANALPSELNGKDCYIIVIGKSCYSDRNWRGYIYSVETDGNVELLASEVEDVITKDSPYIYNICIDDIYVLYGYRLQLGLCINDDLFDEETIETCKTIVKEVEAVQEKYAES